MSPQTQTVTADITMADRSHGILFDPALETIQYTVSDHDRRLFRHYSNIRSMVDAMQHIRPVNQKDSALLQSCIHKVALFAHAFAPYFDVVGSFTSLRPEWPGCFWGIIVLLIRAGSHYMLLLDKIAYLFELLTRGLPQYKFLIPSFKLDFRAATDGRVELISHLFADFVQLFLELYCMFSRSQGARLRHRFFNSGSATWRPLDSRFTYLQQRLARHKNWVERVLGRSNDDITQHQDYKNFLKSTFTACGGIEFEGERMARRLRRIDKVKAWLSNCCSYRDIYEHKISQRHPSSCAWFLESQKYCHWKNKPFDERNANSIDSLTESWHERILFVQGKPGFGKTFISGAIIDDLRNGAEDSNIGNEPPTTVFFHFNASHLYCTSSNDAFRALTAQLVHAHRHDRSTLDALSLLMRKASPYDKASSEDVIDILALLLRQHPTFLVIDGVDECTDVQTLLTKIPELFAKSDARAVLLSRPQIEIPLRYQKWASDSPHILKLSDEHNAGDIRAYVISHLDELADQGFFGINMDRSIFEQVATRSNGTFLWASLLLKYLGSPDLSPEKRRSLLEQSSLLEGLEPLYNGIFGVLERKSGRDKQLAVDVMRWLSLSIRRLCVPGLQIALRFDSKRTSVDEVNLVKLADSLTRSTCGLVEISNCDVTFTHSSVKEYLQSSACRSPEFSLLDESAVHGHLAARCLSFLTNEVPKKPLQKLQPYIRPAPPSATHSGLSIRTGSSRDSGYKSMSSSSDTDGMPADIQQTPVFDANIPFLRYATLCWPIHLTRALSSDSAATFNLASPTSPSSPNISRISWLPALSNFLADRMALTTWTEASWRYNFPPNLSRLLPLLANLKSELPPATVDGKDLRWVVHGLRESSEALNELREQGGTRLRENPSLIWQWATEEGQAQFWPLWDTGRGCAILEEDLE